VTLYARRHKRFVRRDRWCSGEPAEETRGDIKVFACVKTKDFDTPKKLPIQGRFLRCASAAPAVDVRRGSATLTGARIQKTTQSLGHLSLCGGWF